MAPLVLPGSATDYLSTTSLAGGKNTKTSIRCQLFIVYINTQHEDFDFPHNDIALLVIDGEIVPDGTTVDFVTLAETDAEDFVGNNCEMVGWGDTGGQ